MCRGATRLRVRWMAGTACRSSRPDLDEPRRGANTMASLAMRPAPVMRGTARRKSFVANGSKRRLRHARPAPTTPSTPGQASGPKHDSPAQSLWPTPECVAAALLRIFNPVKCTGTINVPAWDAWLMSLHPATASGVGGRKRRSCRQPGAEQMRRPPPVEAPVRNSWRQATIGDAAVMPPAYSTAMQSTRKLASWADSTSYPEAARTRSSRCITMRAQCSRMPPSA